MSQPRGAKVRHLPLHLLLVVAVITTVYPVLWVVTIALSGEQGLAIVDLPADPTWMDRLPGKASL